MQKKPSDQKYFPSLCLKHCQVIDTACNFSQAEINTKWNKKSMRDVLDGFSVCFQLLNSIKLLRALLQSKLCNCQVIVLRMGQKHAQQCKNI